MSQSTRRPLPALPVELKKEILRFCDQGTLAATSRVSFAFLELSSPILYSDIKIWSYEDLNQLLYEAEAHRRQSHLDAYTDRGQIRKVTLVLREDEADSSERALWTGFIKRVPSSVPGPRLLSSQRLPSVKHLFLSIVRRHDSEIISLDFRTILRLFNPSSCLLVASFWPHRPEADPLYVDLHDLGWNRLHHAEMVDVVGSSYLRSSLFRDVAVPFAVMYHVARRWPATGSPDPSHEAAVGAFHDIGAGDPSIDEDEKKLLFSSPLFSGCVFRVKHRQQAVSIATAIREQWERRGVDPEQQKRWRRLVQFRAVGPGGRAEA